MESIVWTQIYTLIIFASSFIGGSLRPQDRCKIRRASSGIHNSWPYVSKDFCLPLLWAGVISPECLRARVAPFSPACNLKLLSVQLFR